MNQRTAGLISGIGHPFVFLLVVFSALAIHDKGFDGAWPTLLAMLGAVLVLAAVVVVKKRRGKVTNLDVSDRSQRARSVYLPVMSLLTVVTLVLYLTQQPFVIETLLFGLMMLVCFAINTRLKISQHTLIAVYSACLVLPIQWVLGVVMLAVAGLIAWSRVVLERHQPAEVIAGAAVAVVFGVLHWYLI